MNTKLLMSSSAILLLLGGAALSFLPQEISHLIGITTSLSTNLCFQLSGSLLVGFGIMNWMAKGAIIGGIYNRPIAIGNFAHFIIAGITLFKALIADTKVSVFILLLTVIYALFAMAFGRLLFAGLPDKKPGRSNTC